MTKEIHKTALNGLILAGGQSTRMNTDKAFLTYFGKPQYQRIYDLIAPYCSQVFVSGRKDSVYELPVIVDSEEYENIGPLAGLLSAYKKHASSWLIVAVDYPLITAEDIHFLIKQRDSSYQATVFFNYDTQFFEPFLGIYEQAFLKNILPEAKKYKYSAQQLLLHNVVKKASPLHTVHLTSVNTIETYERIKNSVDFLALKSNKKE